MSTSHAAAPTPTIKDTPPAAVQQDLNQLREALDSAIPSKQVDRNLLIATWNIRAFGDLTDAWTAGSDDSPKRDLRGLRAIADIIARFDVIAIQEVTGNLRALRHLLKYLGPQWTFLMTDVTRGGQGNGERMAFVFDQRRVQLSGLASELVVPPDWLDELAPDSLSRQFARTPYAVSFRAGSSTFILVTLHVHYGKHASERIPELQGIARWLDDWATRSNRWHHNLIALGDFNIDRRGDALWQAFTSTGLTVPEALHQVRRSIFTREGDDPQLGKFYDQIAWFSDASGKARLSMPLLNAGSFDFLPHVYGDQDLSKASISYRLSDHYPLWAEFSTRRED